MPPIARTWSASIVTYNSDLSQLQVTLDSFINEANSIQREGSFLLDSLYIIDNASEKYYCLRLHEILKTTSAKLEKGNLVYLPQEINKGFGAGHNIAIQKNSSELILILNPDITFYKGTLKQGLNAIVLNPDAGLCVPRVYDESCLESPIHSFRPTPFDIFLRSIAPKPIRYIFSRRLNSLYQLPLDTPVEKGTKAVFSGCCMLFQSQTLKAIEGFNEAFFVYFEDYDLSLRLLKNSEAIIASEFKVIHKGGNSFSKDWKHIRLFLNSARVFYL